MKNTKRRALRLCRMWRLRHTEPMLLFFFAMLAAGCGAAALLWRQQLWTAAACAGAALAFFGGFRLETRALALCRATGAAFLPRIKRRAYLRFLLLPAVRLSLLAATLLPALGLTGVFAAWRSAAYPASALRRLAVCCLLMTGVSLAFFFRWNARLCAAPALLLCGVPFRRSLVLSVRLTAQNQKRLAALRRSFFGWSLLGALLLPLPFTALYFRQSETLVLLNDA